MVHNNEKLRPCPMLENPEHAAAHGAGELGADYDKQRQTASADIPVVGCVARWGFFTPAADNQRQNKARCEDR